MKGTEMYGARSFGHGTAHSRRRFTALAMGAGLLLFFAMAALTPLHPFALFPLFWVLPFVAARAVGSFLPLPRETPATPGEDGRERALLEALERHGQITAARAALDTSLSVAEADERLSDLAEKGHVRVHAHEGTLAYSLWDSSRS